MSRDSRSATAWAASSAHLRRRGDDDDGVEALLAARLVQKGNLDDRDGRVDGRHPRVGGRARLRVQELLEPVELLAVMEDDLADACAVADRLFAPTLANRRAHVSVLREEVVHERVGRQRGSPVARERRKCLALPCRDTAGDRDRERPPSH